MLFPALFARGKLGDLRPKNRICLPALHLGLAEEGRPTEAVHRFYEDRARGGAGLIIAGTCDAWSGDRPGLSGALALTDDGQVPAMAELAERIRKAGAIAGVQISPLAGYNKPDWHPEPELIPKIRDSIGEAARRACEAGFQLVELMLSGGSLLSHFISPAHNTWGIPGYSGGWRERLRLPLESIEVMREATGEGFPILVRIHGHEYLEGGYGIEGADQIVPALERAGVAGFDVTGGGHRTSLPQITPQTPPLAFAYLAQRVRLISELPVLSGGRVREPLEAEAILAASGADFINLGRALIADPEWPLKSEQGREAEIVPCMACGACLDRVMSNRPILCSLNPEVGQREPLVESGDSTGKSALVVGSGPAGLQAAWTLHQMGYQVTIKERDNRPGGRWRLASRMHGRKDLRAALHAFTSRLARAGVPIETGSEVTPEQVRTIGPDVLVLATGGRKRLPEIPGLETHPDVVHVDDLLAREQPAGPRTAILGAGGVGVELAIHLAGEGEPSLAALGFLARYGDPDWLEEALSFRPPREVTLLRRRGYAGRGVGRSLRWTMMRDLERLGVQLIDRTEYREITPDGVLVHDRRQDETILVPADTIAIATGYEPNLEVLERFEGMAGEVIAAGDAEQVRNIGSAVRSAHQAVRSTSETPPT